MGHAKIGTFFRVVTILIDFLLKFSIILIFVAFSFKKKVYKVYKKLKH